jgi:hypothetical protein
MGCGDSLPRPKFIEQPSDAFEAVPYPPPAALSELVPERPSGKSLVWIDGSWVWRGHYYVWQRGGWTESPTDIGFAEWKLRYTDDGRLEYAPSAWRDATGKRKREPIVKPAVSPPNEVTAEFQTGR